MFKFNIMAENSEVINTLIAAAQNGKQVTVFVELKARFDEENNMATAELREKAGIHIIYSIPGFESACKGGIGAPSQQGRKASAQLCLYQYG